MDLVDLDPGELVFSRGPGNGEEQVRVDLVELTAELLEEKSEVLRVLGAVDMVWMGRHGGILPVDVDTVKDPRRHTRTSGVVDDGKVTLDVDIDARLGRPVA